MNNRYPNKMLVVSTGISGSPLDNVGS